VPRVPHSASALVLVLLACEVDEPATLCRTPLAQVALDGRVDDTDTNVRVELAFRDVERSAVARSFCVDDEIRVNNRKATAIRRPSGDTVFALDLSRAAAEYTIQLVRASDTHTWKATFEVVPLEVIEPIQGASISRADPIAVAWVDPTDADRSISILVRDEIDGEDCFAAPYEAEVPDVGAAEVPAGVLTSTSQLFDHTVTCDAFLELLREQESALEVAAGEALHPESVVVAATARQVDFTSVPALP